MSPDSDMPVSPDISVSPADAAASPAAPDDGAYIATVPFDDLREGEGTVVDFHGEDVALFRIGAVVFAVENTCPHQGASLAEGWLEGENVSCPWHAWCFELRTGKMLLGDYAEIAVYPTRVTDGTVFVGPPLHRPN